METINYLKTYPINLNKNNFGIVERPVEDELFTSVWIQKEKYNVEVVEFLSKLWRCPVNYLVGRLRCEAAHKLILYENNMLEGIYYYKLAASENQSVEALFSLSNLKLNVTQSLAGFEESMVHLKQASDNPHTITYKDEETNEENTFTNKFIVESQIMYANLCMENMGSHKKDLVEAKKYYDLALSYNKVKSAIFAKYAIILCRGDGEDIIPKDSETGLKLLKDIINQEGANVQPGIVYTYGMFLFESDPSEGIKYIKHASLQGYPTAKEQLENYENKLNEINNISNNSVNNNNNNGNNSNNKKKNNKQTKKNNLC